MNTFFHEFDELPLVITDTGIEAGSLNIRAEIQYTDDADWEIGSIELQGFGPRDPKTGKRTWPYVQAPAAVDLLIRERLYHQWADKVLNAVVEQIDDDAEAAADHRADMLRDRNEDDL